ncbi:AGE family epimerase/isomerase [Arthrobacter sp. TES]|uniref:AGE family epimerase/isomerase n=1 Tax=Paenarthrobacter ureafaciens TaxID=37931 RepID=UPI000396236D|nr:AGE family epimerase/isomerase [Paenarthrobacter ureafaciens]AOY71644.1 sugar isomerase [Arthrobacter sp. ZXY-2]ERI37834.1 sugar isomerase [Arthrobacter sp. AK-YN10]QOI63460.1 AGE family epimerase/isomerase [Arthrobacter sp. TES]GLU60093.1 sulfoquinovose isomerase [Paenarthrobacter ureafaciens]GLU64491.1 sulfoquinovose isomerase [Paenarthrobacter ureafaciens]
MTWLNSAAHARWLETETDRLINFAAGSKVSTGFGWLDNYGKVQADKPTHLWITARMVHSFAIAALMGRPGAGSLADHGIAALNGAFHDEEFGGWYAEVDVNGPVDDTKSGYQHSFVLLAASSAVAAGRPGAQELLEEALRIADSKFWDHESNMCFDSWNRDFTETEAYRGGNASMHSVEAYLIVADVTGENRWIERALHIAEVLIHQFARNNNYRVFEHFDPEWNPIPDYNTDDRASQFRAYGGTPGHWVEWARLLLHLRAGLEARGLSVPDWLLDDAKGLFDAAIRDAWQPDGNPGFVYSVDWEGKPVVTSRIRWVPVEAIGGAAALYMATGDRTYADWYERIWDHARDWFIDYEHGSWKQELDEHGNVASTVWSGKADVYHLWHCLVVPRLPLAPGLAPALAAGLLDSDLRFGKANS